MATPLHPPHHSLARHLLRAALTILSISLAHGQATNAPAAAPPNGDITSGSTAPPNATPTGTSWAFHPIILTNLAPQPFIQEHPESAPLPLPPTPTPPALALKPGNDTNAPDIIAPNSVDLPQFYHPPSSGDWGNDLASHLLVVYNVNDPDSKDLADYYATRRNIPAERVLGISAPLSEEITRQEYEDTIRSPIVSYLSGKGWLVRAPREVPVGDRMLSLLMATRNDIWAIVLMRGVPLKIAGDPDDLFGMEIKPELQNNAAAVDSELTLLPIFGLPLGGFVPNIFYDGQPDGIKTIGPELARNMILVTRLDGPSVADVRRIIDDSIYVEQHRLAGLAVIDTRGGTDPKNGYTSGDDWLRGARDSLVKAGWTVKFDDKPDVLPPTDPCNQVALYLGWYRQDAYGPWITPPPRFVRGAIAYHLHSFSASTVRSTTANWVGPLIAHGADATMGTVYEPYLALTPHEDIFARRLLGGDYFAAAAWASERGLSWMLTVVGDPLYRPFLPTLNEALAAEPASQHTDHADWLQLQKAKLDYEQGILPPNPQRLIDEINLPNAGPVAHEGIADLLLEFKTSDADTLAESEYRKAANAESQPIDRIRVGLKLSAYYTAHGDSARAQAELDNLRDLYPVDAPRFGIPSNLVPTSMPPNPSPSTSALPPLSPPANRPTPGQNAPPQLPQLPQLPKPTPAP